MRVYSYIVTHDGGFAPNPFHGRLTLACCKPTIRRTAQIGDWVVGLSTGGVRVVYAMRVAAKLPFDQYWSHPEFETKRPHWSATSNLARRGDNIYEPVDARGFLQWPSTHSHMDGTEKRETKELDLGGIYVLVASEFGALWS